MINNDFNNKNIKFNGRFWIDRDSHVFLGPGRIELLEKIDAGNSIAEGARLLGMGYKTAWDMLNDMNNLAEEPLVIRTKGGKHGGGTVLTTYGKKMVTAYRQLESEYQALLLTLEQRYPEVSQWKKMNQRLQLRTSARNQLFCTIQALEKRGHSIIATLDLGNKQFFQAQLTQKSVDEMGLSVGRQVVALFKASSIHLVTQTDQASNILEGALQKINTDEVGGAELEICLIGEQVLITMLNDASLAPELGSTVCAAIDPKQIILAIF